MPLPEGDFPDALILAALARAELHSRHDEPGATYASTVAHLGLRMGSATGHRLRPRFRELEAAGLIVPTKRKGTIYFVATREGRRVLKAAGDVLLPESPQHRAWRETRAYAAERAPGFRDDLHVLLSEGGTLLADDTADSDAWFSLAGRLERACKRLGSATYCLQEWAEPSDGAADLEDNAHRGRRNPRLWQEER